MMKKTLYILFLSQCFLICAAPVEFLSAFYGAGDQKADVLDIIREKAVSGSKSVLVDNTVFGDPATGKLKSLTIVYRLDGQKKELVVHEGTTLSLSEDFLRNFDPVGSSDLVFIKKLIADAVRRGEHKVIIPKGTYHLKPADTDGRHLVLRKLNNLEIDASGSTFILEADLKPGFAFEECNNVIFRNATIINKYPPFSQGGITEISEDRKSVVVQVHQGYRTTFKEGYHTPILNFFDPESRKLKVAQEVYVKSVKEIAPQVLRFELWTNVPNNINLKDLVTFRRIEGIQTAIAHCSDFKYINVTQKNSIGAAIMEVCGEGGNYYNYTLTYAETPEGATEKPLLSGSADGFMSYSTRRGPTLENCFFEGINDDGVNISNVLYFVLERTGNSVIVAVSLYAFGIGDEIGFIDFDLMQADQAKLVGIKPLPDYKTPQDVLRHACFSYRAGTQPVYQLDFDRPVKVEPGQYATNLSRRGDGFVVRNCTFKDKRARGCLLRGSSGLVENCLFENILEGAISTSPEIYGWGEGPHIRNLTVRNNVFRNVNMAPMLTWGAAVYICHYEGSYRPMPISDGAIRNIILENNRFENNNGPQIVVSTANDVIIRKNMFINPMMKPVPNPTEGMLDYNALIWATRMVGLHVKDNLIQNPGPQLKRLVAFGPDVLEPDVAGGVTIQQATE